jgi:hypothetical protein
MRTRGLPLLLPLALTAVSAAACGGADPASGITAYLRVANAQFEPGELTTTNVGAQEPTVDMVQSNNTDVFPGAQARAITGSVNGAGKAVLIGLAGDTGHWLVPVGSPDLTMVGDFTFSASLSFSPLLPAGQRALVFRAVDVDGNVGPPESLTLNVLSSATQGALVIQLVWDTDVDLDLHVRIMDAAVPKTGYFDVWNRAPLALPPLPNGATYTDAQVAAAGKLLFDSNSQCVIDGRNHEEVVFPGAYPSGPYEVRVDTFSLCAESEAHWHVSAFTNPSGTPAVLAAADGQSMDRDTVSDHGAGAGVLAFTFAPP